MPRMHPKQRQFNRRTMFTREGAVTPVIASTGRACGAP